MPKHTHLPRDVNRRLPARQPGPDPALLPVPPVAPLVRPPSDSSESSAEQPAEFPVIPADNAAGGELFELLRAAADDDPSRGLIISDYAAARAARVPQAATVPARTAGAATRPSRDSAVREPVLDSNALRRSSVATEAQATYERVGDTRNSEPAVTRRPNARPGQFTTPILKDLQMLMQEV